MPVDATTPQSCAGLRLCVIPDARRAITRDRVHAKDQAQGLPRRPHDMNAKTLLILTPALLALSLSAQAQPGHPPGMHGEGPPMAEMKAMHEAMAAQRMTDMKTLLRLRADQESALAALMEAEGPKVMMLHGGPGGMMRPPKAMTTPERLDDMAKQDADRTAAQDKGRKALATFYAVLSPDQQKAFDALSRLRQAGPGGPGGPDIRRIIMRGGPAGSPSGSLD